MNHEHDSDLVVLGEASEATEGLKGYPMETDGLWMEGGLSAD